MSIGMAGPFGEPLTSLHSSSTFHMMLVRPGVVWKYGMERDGSFEVCLKEWHQDHSQIHERLRYTEMIGVDIRPLHLLFIQQHVIFDSDIDTLSHFLHSFVYNECQIVTLYQLWCKGKGKSLAPEAPLRIGAEHALMACEQGAKWEKASRATIRPLIKWEQFCVVVWACTSHFGSRTPSFLHPRSFVQITVAVWSEVKNLYPTYTSSRHSRWWLLLMLHHVESKSP